MTQKLRQASESIATANVLSRSRYCVAAAAYEAVRIRTRVPNVSAVSFQHVHTIPLTTNIESHTLTHENERRTLNTSCTTDRPTD